MRGRPQLALAVLALPAAVLASPTAQQPAVHATIVVDLAPAPGVPAWYASAFEQSITRELSGFERISPAVKADLGIARCGSDNSCKLDAYKKGAVDVVLFGQVRDEAIDYELYQTWTPARLATGSIDIHRGQTAIGLKQETRRAFHPVLKHGGLLDQRPYMLETAPAATTTETDTTLALAIAGGVIGALVLPLLVLAIRFGLGTLRTTRSARRVAVVATIALVLAGGGLRWLSTSVPAIAAGIGGLGWGAVLVLTARAMFPPLDGLQRVAHHHLFAILRTWSLACVERGVVLAAVYVPLGYLVVAIGDALALPARWTFLLVAPAIVLTARLVLTTWIECLAALLDARLVSGLPTSDNPWSREIASYLMGYIRRTGLDLDPEVLRSVVFLPASRPIGDGVIAYGGGATHVRVVIDPQLLELALGPLTEAETTRDEKPAQFADWTAGLIAPGGKRHTTPEGQRFKRRVVYPGVQRKPIGQAATLLGYVTPAPGQLVPLISDNPADLAVVRELLSEHYPWNAPDPDEEFDDTDPTDKDMLFGALARELGAVRRGDTQLATLRVLLGRRLAWRSRYGTRLADGYAALNFARHPLIQFLHYQWCKERELLTARAGIDELHDTSLRILKRIAPEPAKGIDRKSRALRSRLVWLSLFFAEPIADRRETRFRRIAIGAVAAAVLAGIGFAVKRAVDYHPTYVQRMQAPERNNEEAHGKKAK